MATTKDTSMRVLVACEFSGIVRDAFRAKGHDAWSCDLLPTEREGPHIQDDVLKHLDDGWDLMIAHPPCTYLCYSGARVWNAPGRKQLRTEAMEFFMHLICAWIPKICVENPHGLPRVAYRPPDQEVHPYYFGEPHMKRTLLWLKNLPLLQYELEDSLFWKRTATEKPKPLFIRKDGNKQYFCATVKTKDRARTRSRTFQGIANAMADQWG
jgi:hypothetical protein